MRITSLYTAVAAVLVATVATGLAQQAPMAPTLEKYQPVTADRLKNPEAGNWLMIRRTYDGWGYSPLDQITRQNVARLRPLWGFSTGETRVHESAPIVNNGVKCWGKNSSGQLGNNTQTDSLVPVDVVFE